MYSWTIDQYQKRESSEQHRRDDSKKEKKIYALKGKIRYSKQCFNIRAMNHTKFFHVSYALYKWLVG